VFVFVFMYVYKRLSVCKRSNKRERKKEELDTNELEK